MKVKRLNGAIRDEIRGQILAEAFVKEREAIRAEKRELGLKLYRKLVPEEIEQAARDFPEHGYIVFRDDLRFMVHSKSDGKLTVFHVNFDRSFPVTVNNQYGNMTIANDEKLYRLVMDFEKKEQKLDEKFRELEAKVRTALLATNSGVKLAATWPEIEKFIPDEPEDVSLPALPFTDLNRMLKTAGVELGK
jgi:hypothetical protein